MGDQFPAHSKSSINGYYYFYHTPFLISITLVYFEAQDAYFRNVQSLGKQDVQRVM